MLFRSTHSSMPPKGQAPHLRPIEETDDFDRIEKSGTSDTKPIRILLRLPQDVVDRLVKQAIEEGLKSSDERKQAEAAALKKQWLLGGAFKKKRYQAAAIRLLDNLIEKAVEEGETKKSLYWNLVGIKTQVIDSVQARNIEYPRRERLLDDLPQGVADAEANFLLKIEVSKAIVSTFAGSTISKQPVHLVLQILESALNKPPSDGFYHAFVDVSEDKKPKVSSSENNYTVSRLTESSKSFLTDGLLKSLSTGIQKLVDTL